LNFESRKLNPPTSHGSAAYISQVAALQSRLDLLTSALDACQVESTPPPATVVISSVVTTPSTLSNMSVGTQLKKRKQVYMLSEDGKAFLPCNM
jgi:hypothetical protein